MTRRPFTHRPFTRRPFDVRGLLFTTVASIVVALLTVIGGVCAPARATPALTMDVATGEVLYQEEATQPWFPASTTKLMTVYVALSAVRDHQIAMDTPLVVSARAHKMPPSKMGFAPGTQVTLENALKMLMVRSANDVAITVAEGVAGSVEAFADDMNQTAAQLGMRESHFVNPNGLPDSEHVSSARDMAILARALYTQFPEQASLFNLGELSLGAELIPNHNNLLGRYPGADGMKTGFTCAAGFNVVASAYRDGRRIVVVVFGAPTVKTRTEKVAALFDRGFAGIDRPIASVMALPSAGGGGAPDMHNQVCRAGRNGLIARFNAQVEQLDTPLTGQPGGGGGIGLSALSPEKTFLFGAAAASPVAMAPAGGPTAERISMMPQPAFDPVPVHVGAEPGYAGVVAQARAPHTPIGSDTPPVTAEAYAAPPVAAKGIGGSPLEVDPNALPLKGHRTKAARLPRRGRVGMKAAAEAPVTKVMAGAGDEGGAADKAEAEKPAKTPAKKAAKAEGKRAAAKGAKAEPKSTNRKAAAKAEPKPAAKKAAAKKAEPSTKKAEAGR